MTIGSNAEVRAAADARNDPVSPSDVALRLRH